ncbi:L-carnitine dehydrogenase [Thalassobaculum fulvum]|uniref:L-carnitine dehydrogenase n=1 Tax=Thalassobaculum fulvum TaxID=1633335 RepID=A0A918XTW8_9PROT|nr:3-hydroxyacyl-CoA dehydrogenase NAD-binding domain-containing protein [Thalassobaculum fulvum]GHD55884.1 L-carnitine dehydrogenase [Thalassobaculum fulvum]
MRRDIRRVALLGAGVIGAGWAARLVESGIDVVVADPDPEVHRKTGAVLQNAERALRALFPEPPARRGSVDYAASVEAAVDGADFVQESAPEREDLKRALLARADAVAPADVILATSTSGLLPSRLQADCRHPGRVVVGHPFNPVYLLPLVEVCGGAATAPETVPAASAFYASIGMHPLHVRTEIDGFVADRLLEALWREALHLVNDGVATTDEIDRAICHGAGLRWAFMGTFGIYRLAGGEAGMRHFMAQFGPALKLPWTRLEAPELTEALVDRVSEQAEAQAAGRSVRDMERSRDDALVAILRALEAQGIGAGADLARWRQGREIMSKFD